jgi:hypothetical protein
MVIVWPRVQDLLCALELTPVLVGISSLVLREPIREGPSNY